MLESIRRVHKLRLTAQDENALHGDINALEDAFRIASLPGIPPHGLLLVKKLDLGRFHTRSSSLTLSQLIDNRLRRLAPAAVCVDQGEHARHDLVWFSDTAQAAICLVDLVVTERAPRAWYWRAVFPSWRAGMGLQQTLAAIAADQRGRASTQTMLAHAIERQLAGGSLARVMDAITPRLTQTLLRDAGMFSGPVNADITIETSLADSWRRHLSPVWIPIIERAVATWGSGDTRSLWLGYSALTTQNPALVADTGLLARVRSAIEALANAAIAPGGYAPSATGDRPVRPEPAVEADTAPGVEAPTGVEPGPSRSQPGPGAAASASQAPVEARTQLEAPQSEFPPGSRSNSVAPDPASRGPRGDLQNRPVQNAKDFAAAEAGVTLDDVRGFETGAAEDTSTPSVFSGLVECHHGGLVFLVSLLELLSIKTLLEKYPALALINLPAQVIADVAHRLRIPASHPLLQALPRLNPAQGRIDAFGSPQSWQALIAPKSIATPQLHRYDTTPCGRRCYLTDRSGNLLLYVGSDDLPQWTGRCAVTRHRGEFEPPGTADLSRTLQLLMSRYLRRHAGMSLRQAINRVARIASTRSHLDVLFDMKHGDIRIRKSGLDIDPGWVAWLARVVQFHYEEGETADA